MAFTFDTAREILAAPSASALDVQPADLAPDSVHTYRNSFQAERCNDGKWAVYQITTWIDRNGEDDGDVCDLAYGLTEAEARDLAERVSAADAGRGRKVAA